jgi:ADP-heptose:LPS heptosyltransferase
LDPKGNINNLRRKLTRFFSRLFISNKFLDDVFNENVTQVKKILICRPNHRLGNNLLLTPLVKEVNKIFPNAEIHLFTKGNLGNIVFENYKDVTRLIKLPRKPFKNLITYFACWLSLLENKYDLVINANRQSSSGKLAVKLSKSNYKFYNTLNSNLFYLKDYRHHAKNSIYNLRFQLKNKINRDKKKIYKLDIKLRDYEIEYGNKLLKSMFSKEKPVISIFTFATGDKCFNKEWWKNLYLRIKEFENQYNILEILPVENISQIDFTAKSYYSRNIREISSVMHNSKIFIGADSGMMHLAHASNVTTIGLFNVTSPEFYGVYGDKNISINTNNHSIEYIINSIMDRI